MIQTVDKLLRRLEASTDPFEGLMDGTQVFIKTYNSRWSNRILVNEYICLCMAKILNISIPDGGFCYINSKTDIKDVEEYMDPGEDIEGIAFYSIRLDRVSPIISSQSVIESIVNKNDINKVILFDHLIYNNDRHHGNILLNYSKENDGFKMYIIDHSHVFNISHRWDTDKLEKLMVGKDYKDTKILHSNYSSVYKTFNELKLIKRDELYNEVANFKSLINRDVLLGIIKEVPKEWIHSKTDIDKLVEYILYRLENLEYIVEMIIEYLNNPGGE